MKWWNNNDNNEENNNNEEMKWKMKMKVMMK